MTTDGRVSGERNRLQVEGSLIEEGAAQPRPAAAAAFARVAVPIVAAAVPLGEAVAQGHVLQGQVAGGGHREQAEVKQVVAGIVRCVGVACDGRSEEDTSE